MRARAAVLLYRQCTALNVAGFDPRLVAQVIDLTLLGGDLRPGARRAAPGRPQPPLDPPRPPGRGRALPGQSRGFRRRVRGSPRSRWHATTSGGSPDPIDCPTQTVGIVRTTGPEPVRGDIGTVSAARDGVSVGVVFGRTLVHEALVGSTGGPCHVRATGAETLVPSLVGGFRGAAFDPTPTYDGPPLPSIVRFRSAGRFGRSFTIESRASRSTEPLTNGTWITSSGPVEFQFDLCDGGGRRPGGC